MDSIHELGSTWTMTWTLSEPLDATPRLSVVDDLGTVVHSVWAQSSGTLMNFWMPMCINSCGDFLYEWAGFRTTIGSTFPILQRGTFRVRQTHLDQP